jgi:hypothetical protein
VPVRFSRGDRTKCALISNAFGQFPDLENNLSQHRDKLARVSLRIREHVPIEAFTVERFECRAKCRASNSSGDGHAHKLRRLGKSACVRFILYLRSSLVTREFFASAEPARGGECAVSATARLTICPAPARLCLGGRSRLPLSFRSAAKSLWNAV